LREVDSRSKRVAGDIARAATSESCVGRERRGGRGKNRRYRSCQIKQRVRRIIRRKDIEQIELTQVPSVTMPQIMVV
jgi:hypothetical protein